MISRKEKIQNISLLIAWLGLVFSTAPFLGKKIANNISTPIQWDICGNGYIMKLNICVPDAHEIPTEPRAYIDYVIKNGIWYWTWRDYIIFTPHMPQPSIQSKFWWVNNDEILKYIADYSKEHTFDLPDWVNGWYIMFTTKKELWAWIYDNLFLAIGEMNKWVIKKNESLSPYNPNEYLYDLTSIPQVSDISKRSYITNILNFVVKWKLSVTWVVWEQWNEVEKITIVFKK